MGSLLLAICPQDVNYSPLSWGHHRLFRNGSTTAYPLLLLLSYATHLIVPLTLPLVAVTHCKHLYCTHSGFLEHRHPMPNCFPKMVITFSYNLQLHYTICGYLTLYIRSCPWHPGVPSDIHTPSMI
jgi:hypothetical protein